MKTTKTYMLRIMPVAIAGLVLCSCTSKDKPPVEQPATVSDVQKQLPPALPATKTATITTNIITGRWTLSQNIPQQQLRSVLGPELGDNDHAEMTLTGTQDFKSNGAYASRGQMRILIKSNMQGGEMDMVFNFDETGDWHISGDTVIGVTGSAFYKAANDFTREVLNGSPALAQALTPTNGETTKLLAVSVKPNELVFVDVASGWKSVLKR